MVELGIRLDSMNDKSDIDNINYMNNDKKSDKDKNFNNRNRNDNNNYFRTVNNFRNIFRNNYDNRDNNRNRDKNYNNNFRYYDRNYGNNNSRYQDNYNNYNYNNYRYNNNNQSNYEKVDSTKNKDDNDFNVNNLSGDMLNDKDNVFMTTLKVNDIVTSMQVDIGSKHTIIPHGLAKKLGIRDVKKSELQLTAYDGNLIKIIGITQVKVTYEGISKYLQVVVVESRKNALLGRIWINAFKNILKKFIANVDINYEDEIKKLIKECESKLTNGPINKASVKLHLKRDAQPKIIPPSRIPYLKIDLMSNELKKWIPDKIIEPVNDVRWASPVTAVYKDDGSIRLCADFKDSVNPALEDFRYPLSQSMI
ncbi:mitochondrial substrate carrier family protein Y-like [Gordionus sp. m RMFG-2023]|uniref:mitochondrial substrate carrier family protein Y-like n=1 Tax=Gordionus sp. m RMFG-2023 TaxID=3053472 RepID=UPI0031FD6810